MVRRYPCYTHATCRTLRLTSTNYFLCILYFEVIPVNRVLRKIYQVIESQR